MCDADATIFHLFQQHTSSPCGIVELSTNLTLCVCCVTK